MIKAIIFDFYGVLAARGEASFRKQYLEKDPVKNKEARRLNELLGKGDLSYDGFIDELAKLGGVDRKTVLSFTEDYKPNTDLLDYIRGELKPRLKIGIISNAGADWVPKILGPENISLFDDIILSYKTGLIKPDPKIYELSAANLAVKTGECLFVDDIERYCQGAEQVGMSSVWYRGFDKFKKELEPLLAAGSNN